MADEEKRQCVARNRQGERCKRAPIPGGAVCNLHGGKAPQVIANAKLRLAAMVDPAIGVLDTLLRKSKVDAVRLAAVKDILDRNGFKPKDELDVDLNAQVTTYDAARLAALSDEELQFAIKLAEKLSAPADEDPLPE